MVQHELRKRHDPWGFDETVKNTEMNGRHSKGEAQSLMFAGSGVFTQQQR